MTHLKKFLFLSLTLFHVSIFGDHLLIRSTNNSWQDWPAQISEFKSNTIIDGLYARTDLLIKIKDLYSYGYNNDSMEAELEFTLPKGSVIDSMYLWIYDKPEPAYLKEKSFAVKLYEDIVDRKEDPALLIKNEGTDTYVIKIFPFLYREERTIKICYSSLLDVNNNNLSFMLPTHLTATSEMLVNNIECKILVKNRKPDDVFIEDFYGFSKKIVKEDTEITFVKENDIIDDPVSITINNSDYNDKGLLLQFTENSKKEKYFSALIKPSKLFKIDQKPRNYLFVWNNVASSIELLEYYSYYYNNDIKRNKQMMIDYLSNYCKENDKVNIIINDGDISSLSETMIQFSDSTLIEVKKFLEDSLSKSNKSIRCVPPDEMLVHSFKSVTVEDSAIIIIIDDMIHQGKNSDKSFVEEKVAELNKILPSTSKLWWCIHRGNSNMISDIYTGIIHENESVVAFTDASNPIDVGLIELTKYYEEYLYPANLTFSSNNRFPFDILGPKPEKWYCNEAYHLIGKIHNSSNLNITFNGVLNDEQYAYDSSFVINEKLIKSNDMSNVWASKKIGDILAESKSNLNKKDARNVSLDYRILGDYTSLIALEESVVDSLNITDDEPSDIFVIDTIFLSDNEQTTDNSKMGNMLVQKEMKITPINNRVLISLPSVACGKKISQVSIEIYDVRGRLVADLSNKITEGVGIVSWETTNISKGSYILKLKVGKKAFIKRFSIVK